MTAVNVTYSAATGATIYCGRSAPSVTPNLLFDSVSIFSDSGTGLPAQVQNQIPVMELHASGGGAPGQANTTANRQYRAAVSGRMAYEEHVEFGWRLSGTTSGAFNGNKSITMIRPISYYGRNADNEIRQGWQGFVTRESPFYYMITANRLDGLRNWMEVDLAADENPSSINMKYLCLTGGSMGAWGTMHYGLRRPRKFAALYPDRPRWRWDYDVGQVDYSKYDTGGVSGTVANSPAIDPLDGGGTVAAVHNSIDYVSNPANFVPWIGWSIGSNDGFMPWQDHIDAVAALRAAGRPFAMAWNRGNHSGGMILSKILASYPFGTFEIGKGCPLFTEHSLDVDPTTDAAVLEGGVNLGLAFRNVVETPTGWTCEVTHISTPCTVKVRPVNSDVFTATVASKLVTIPAAKTWVAVSFTA